MRSISGAKTFCMVLAALMLSVMLTPAGFAAIGVKAGDWIKYDYTVTGAPSGTVLPTWMKVEFLSVEGTNATVRVTMHMSDGTEQSDIMTINVVAGEGTVGTFSGFVIPAGRTTGDSIYITGYGNVTIEGETERTYAPAHWYAYRRTAVYAGFSQYGTQLTYYWDKQTGIMMESSITSINMTVTAKTTGTNMWEAIYLWMEWWLWAIVTVAIVVLAVTVYLKRRRLRARWTRTKDLWIVASTVELMICGVLVGSIEYNYRRIIEAPTIGLTMFLIGLALLMIFSTKIKEF